MAVRAEPLMVPVPLAASIAVMSAASAAPAESVELKLVGSVSRKPIALTIRSAVPLMAVRAEPSMVPVPFEASKTVMSSASAAPAASVELKLVGSVSRSRRA